MKSNTFVIDDEHTYYIKDTTIFNLIAKYLIDIHKFRESLSHIPEYNNQENRYVLDSHVIVFTQSGDEGTTIMTTYIPKGNSEYAAKLMQYLGVYVDKNPTVPLQKRSIKGDPYPNYTNKRNRRPIFME